jgi:hypothetical protein
MPSRSVSRFTPALLSLGIGLAVVNWYVQPAKAVAWGSATALLIVLLVVWAYATLILRRPEVERTWRQAGASISGGVVFAGLILVCSLALKLAMSFGAVDDPDLSQRITNAIMGAFFVFTGNALPKMLTPLSSLRCDAARVQRFQRFAGWTWVLAGLGFAYVWLVLPVNVAEPVSVLLLMGAVLIIGTQCIRLRRAPQREA